MCLDFFFFFFLVVGYRYGFYHDWEGEERFRILKWLYIYTHTYLVMKEEVRDIFWGKGIE